MIPYGRQAISQQDIDAVVNYKKPVLHIVYLQKSTKLIINIHSALLNYFMRVLYETK